MAAALSQFFPHVMPYAYGVSDPMAEQVIRSACIEFARKTTILRVVGAESTVVGQPDYDVELLPQTELHVIVKVLHRRRPLTPRARDMVDHAAALRGEAVDGENVAPGTPTEWFQRDTSQPTVSVYPIPDAAVAGALTIVAAVKPTETATTVPDELYDHYAEAIGAGAVARLLLMPGQPFSNPTLAAVYRGQFVAAMTAASITARVGRAAGSLRVVPGFFAK